MKTSLHLYSIVKGLFLALALSTSLASFAKSSTGIAEEVANSLSLREIGPALMGGRIADIAVDKNNNSIWYVAVGSGGLWKTTNAGITFKPIFEKQTSYSVGVVTIDPNNSNTIWLGSGENVSGRHVGWGDGVYKSLDGGNSWENMGLKDSQHIGKILIDPNDSNTILVAAEGPLWSSGGDRGVYKSTDGGKSWGKVLSIDKNTGVTDLEFMPGNSKVVYAAAYQRRRTVWALLAGGPKSGIYKSSDTGESWRRLESGLPAGDMGKIGLAVTPANPNLVYATIEAKEQEKGLYRSTNQGESWSKQSAYISGGTGPHYYQEIEVSANNPNVIYQMDVFLHRSNDSGKNFEIVGTAREKHSDNHAMWLDSENEAHYLVGTDGGLYETFDSGLTYRHFANMPIAQFYKVATDNATPFYNLLAGAQDLGTLYGPSRTMTTDGVRNRDWYIPLGADGYGVSFHPKDDNTLYMMWQGGSLMRHNKSMEESIFIQPQAAEGDAPERWNWDSPIAQSPFHDDRIYFGSQRVWMSDDRGNHWQAISGDLTKNKNRYDLKIAGRKWGLANSLYDTYAMSMYNTTTTLSESPIAEGTIYAGTDDGTIQVTSDAGAHWKSSSRIGKLPKGSFIQDIEASLFDGKRAFAVASNHKQGDFKPYVFITNDKGNSWQSISGDLPKGVITWSIQQDHINKNLLFIGAENGIYFSLNVGKNWHRFTKGVPTIPFRDIKIQRRDNDLVGASFGRGIFILDDYSSLRDMTSQPKESQLYSVRDAWWYVPLEPMQAKGQPSLGSDGFEAANPDFGATFTYYLNQDVQSLKAKRKHAETKLRKQKSNIKFPGYEALKSERLETKPRVTLLVKNDKGIPIRWIKANTTKGLHRASWNLRLPAPDPISLTKPKFQPPWAGDPIGPLAAPGKYSAELMLIKNGKVSSLAKPQSFIVKPVPNAKGIDYQAVADFQFKVADLIRRGRIAGVKIKKAQTKLKHMREALLRAPKADYKLFKKLADFGLALEEISTQMQGDQDRGRLNEAATPSISERSGYASFAWATRQAPTQTMKASYAIANRKFVKLESTLTHLLDVQLVSILDEMEKAGAPSSK